MKHEWKRRRGDVVEIAGVERDGSSELFGAREMNGRCFSPETSQRLQFSSCLQFRDGLQLWRVGCNGRLVLAPSGGASMFEWNLAFASHLVWNSESLRA